MPVPPVPSLNRRVLLVGGTFSVSLQTTNCQQQSSVIYMILLVLSLLAEDSIVDHARFVDLPNNSFQV